MCLLMAKKRQKKPHTRSLEAAIRRAAIRAPFTVEGLTAEGVTASAGSRNAEQELPTAHGESGSETSVGDLENWMFDASPSPNVAEVIRRLEAENANLKRNVQKLRQVANDAVQERDLLQQQLASNLCSKCKQAFESGM